MAQSLSSPYVAAVRSGMSIEDVMRTMRCNRGTAHKRLAEAQTAIDRGVHSAVDLLLHSGGTREMPLDSRGKALSRKHSWTDLALGIRKAA